MEREVPAEPRLPIRTSLLKNNKTGYNGICETFARTKKGEKIPCWAVSWYTAAEKLHCKKFYFHDEQERREMLKEAIRFRKERETEILRNWQKKQRRKETSP